GFAFAIIEAMTEEAVRQGLTRDLADTLVQQTVRGAATMLRESGAHPAVAKAGVCSPGGTTAEGYAAFEREGVRAGLAATMAAAAERSRELAQGCPLDTRGRWGGWAADAAGPGSAAAAAGWGGYGGWAGRGAVVHGTLVTGAGIYASSCRHRPVADTCPAPRHRPVADT